MFSALMRLPLPKRWRLEPATLGWSSKELVSPRGDRIPFRMKSKIEIANNVMKRVGECESERVRVPAKDAKGAKI